MRRIALVLLLACACRGKSSDAPCGTVASRMFTLAQEALAKETVDPVTRRAVADQLPAMRDSLTQICREGAWSAQVRNCMANAADHLTMQACQQQLTDEQRRGLDRAARGETSSP